MRLWMIMAAVAIGAQVGCTKITVNNTGDNFALVRFTPQPIGGGGLQITSGSSAELPFLLTGAFSNPDHVQEVEISIHEPSTDYQVAKTFEMEPGKNYSITYDGTDLTLDAP